MFERIVKEIRHLLGLMMLIVAGTVFLIPAVVSAVVFAIASVLCVAVFSVGGILAAVCFIPVILLTPGGVDSIFKAIDAETK